MNHYQLRLDAKRRRLLKAAEAAEQASVEAYERAREIGHNIPLGQPILVGHHSEAGHRADLRRIDNAMRKSVTQQARAQELRRRAEAVGTAGISADDPEAISKLEAKLEGLHRLREQYRLINKLHAAYIKNPATDLSAVCEKAQNLIKTYEPRYSSEPHPVAPWQLKNLGARIRSTRQRLERLKRERERQQTTGTTETKTAGIRLVENADINRLQLFFPSKPREAVRSLLKRRGFHWSPTQGAWQRQLTDSARWAAKEVIRLAVDLQ